MKKIFIFILIIITLSLASCSKEVKRDKARIIYIGMAQDKVNLYYSNNNEYPRIIKGDRMMPIDEKNGEEINGCKFEILYNFKFKNDKWIEGGPNEGCYMISSCLESEEMINKYAKTDGGPDDKKYEVGDINCF